MSDSTPQSVSSRPRRTRAIRIDADVQRELYERRLPGETNHDEVIWRALEETALTRKLESPGLTTPEVARLHALQAMRGAL